MIKGNSCAEVGRRIVIDVAKNQGLEPRPSEIAALLKRMQRREERNRKSDLTRPSHPPGATLRPVASRNGAGRYLPAADVEDCPGQIPRVNRVTVERCGPDYLDLYDVTFRRSPGEPRYQGNPRRHR